MLYVSVGDLLDLLESTGSQFISQTDLKQLLRLFKSNEGKRLEVSVCLHETSLVLSNLLYLM